MGRLISLRLGSSADIKTIMVPSPSTVLHGGEVTVPTIPRSRPGPVTDLILPTTQQEYIDIMEEITKLYQKRKYKQCSARCIQILDNITDPYRVHPLHSIYISFYTASSLELTARSLHINSSEKLPTFQQSLYYYQHAESFVDYARFSADPSLIKALRQRSSSLSSSIRSSVDSVFSTSSSSTSSPLSSPTSSIYGVAELVSSLSHTRNLSKPEIKPRPQKVQKRVSFSETLHFSDEDEKPEGKLSFRDSLLLESFPSPPISPIVSQSSTLSPTTTSLTTYTTPAQDSIQSYLFSRSLTRYLSHLSSMHTQLQTHIASTNTQIRVLTTSKKVHRSNLSNLFDASTRNYTSKTAAHDVRQVQLRARIERLKREGWRRPRFNPEPYQRLCEDVEREMI